MPVAAATPPRASIFVAGEGTPSVETLRSVLGQTERALEVLVAGARGSLAEAAGDARLRTIEAGRPSAGGALAAALASARAPWLKVVSPDDVLELSCIERELAVLDARPDARAVFSLPEIVDEGGSPVTEAAIVRRWTPSARDGKALAHELIERCPIVPATVLFSVDAALALGGADVAMSLLAEHDLWLRLSHRHEVVVLPEKLARVRRPIRDGAAATAEWRAERADSLFRLVTELRERGWERVLGDAGRDGDRAARRLAGLARSLERSGLVEMRPFAVELVALARALDPGAAREPVFESLRGVARELARTPAWRDGMRSEPAGRGALTAAVTALRTRLEQLAEELDAVVRARSQTAELVEDLGVEGSSARVLSERVLRVSEQALGKLQIRRRISETGRTLFARGGGTTVPEAEDAGAAEPDHASEPRAQVDAILGRYPERAGTVLFAPTLRWSHELFQRPHQLALELARQGFVVFYCESLWFEPGAPSFVPLAERLYAARAPLAAYADVESPIVFFLSYNAFDLAPLRRARAVYELIDELHVFRGDAAEIAANHERLLDTADVVVATARNLLAQVAVRRPDAILCPNAADYEHFRRAREPSLRVPEELARRLRPGRPVVGYYGALATWFDYELVRFAALERPDVDFVLIGPDYDGSLAATDLPSLANVHRLDSQPYATLPAYLRAFDVAMIPFVINDITESTSPIKLFEYMAGGKPVVTTPMQECLRHPEVLVVRDGTELVASLERALALARDGAYLASLDAVARENTWAARVAQIRAALEAGRR
jgi:hypothetical protein